MPLRTWWSDPSDATPESLYADASKGALWASGLYAALHLLGPGPGPGLGLLGVLLADYFCWVHAPLMGVGLVITGVLALARRGPQILPAACALGLLTALMARDIFTILT